LCERSKATIDRITLALKKAARVSAGRKRNPFSEEQLQWATANLQNIQQAVELCCGDLQDENLQPLRLLFREWLTSRLPAVGCVKRSSGPERSRLLRWYGSSSAGGGITVAIGRIGCYSRPRPDSRQFHP